MTYDFIRFAFLAYHIITKCIWMLSCHMNQEKKISVSIANLTSEKSLNLLSRSERKSNNWRSYIVRPSVSVWAKKNKGRGILRFNQLTKLIGQWLVKMEDCLFSISKRKNSRLDLATKKSVIPFRPLLPKKWKTRIVEGRKSIPKLYKVIYFSRKKIFD